MKHAQIKKLVLCAILAAMSVVMLSIGCFIEVLDLSAAMIATVLISIALVEGGYVRASLTYTVTAILGIIILPVKLPAVIYAFSGYYPIIKSFIEKIKGRILSFVVKLLFFNASLCALFFIMSRFLPQAELFPELAAGKVWTYVFTFTVGNAIFILYDILLTRVISLYLFKIRHRLGLDKNR